MLDKNKQNTNPESSDFKDDFETLQFQIDDFLDFRKKRITTLRDQDCVTEIALETSDQLKQLTVALKHLSDRSDNAYKKFVDIRTSSIDSELKDGLIIKINIIIKRCFNEIKWAKNTSENLSSLVDVDQSLIDTIKSIRQLINPEGVALKKAPPTPKTQFTTREVAIPAHEKTNKPHPGCLSPEACPVCTAFHALPNLLSELEPGFKRRNKHIKSVWFSHPSSGQVALHWDSLQTLIKPYQQAISKNLGAFSRIITDRKTRTQQNLIIETLSYLISSLQQAGEWSSEHTELSALHQEDQVLIDQLEVLKTLLHSVFKTMKSE